MEIIRDKTYKVGNAKITRVTETQLTALTPATLYPDWDEAVLDDDARSLVLGHRHERRDHVILSVSTWVIELEGQITIVDTGIGNDKVRPFGQMFHQLQTPFMARLEAVGVRPEKVDHHVLLTHLHVDHVGWNTRLVDGCWVPTFPNAKYVFPEREQEYFATPEGGARRMIFEDSVLPVIEAGQAITIGPRGATIAAILPFTRHLVIAPAICRSP